MGKQGSLGKRIKIDFEVSADKECEFQQVCTRCGTMRFLMTSDNSYIFCAECRSVSWFNVSEMEKPPRCMTDPRKRVARVAVEDEMPIAGVTWDGRPLRGKR